MTKNLMKFSLKKMSVKSVLLSRQKSLRKTGTRRISIRPIAKELKTSCMKKYLTPRKPRTSNSKRNLTKKCMGSHKMIM